MTAPIPPLRIRVRLFAMQREAAGMRELAQRRRPGLQALMELAENDAEGETRPSDTPEVHGREEMLRERLDDEGDHR